MNHRHTYNVTAFIVAGLMVLSGLAHADLLYDYFGVTLELDTDNSYEDTYQEITSYPMDPDSFTPTRDLGPGNWVTGDWYGSWSTTDIELYESGPDAGQYPAGAEPYDVEAIYFDNDAANAYISIVTSFDPSPGHTESRIEPATLVVTGDLAIDLGINSPYAEDGFCYDYGVDINHEERPEFDTEDAASGGPQAEPGNKVYQTENSDWYTGTPTAAVDANGELTNFDPDWAYGTFLGEYKGTATVTYSAYDFGANDETLAPTYVIDITIPLDLLPPLEVGDPIGIGWVEGCRDDGNDFDACLRLEGQIVPEPGTVALMALGMCALGWLRRRRSTD